MIDLSKFNKIRFNDYSEYDDTRCNNGGCYGFWDNYTRCDDGWRVSYGTTAEFDFCPICGGFGNSCGCSDEDYLIVTTEELLDKIASFEEDEDHFIEYL